MRVLLACVGGMSTSLIVSKMEKEAKRREIECSIEAIDFPAIENIIEDYDVLLLGPQITYKFHTLKRKFGDRVPVEIIDAQSYGMCDGAAVLDQAIRMYNSRHSN